MKKDDAIYCRFVIMNNWTRLKLLIWKHYCFHKYYWWIAVIEILLPIFLMYIIIRISHVFVEVQEYTVENSSLHAIDFERHWDCDVVLYTPATYLTRALMQIVIWYSGRVSKLFIFLTGSINFIHRLQTTHTSIGYFTF